MSENTSTAGMDHELHFSDLEKEWQVWTPAYDQGLGAILGTGKTPEEAKADAVLSMAVLSAELQPEAKPAREELVSALARFKAEHGLVIYHDVLLRALVQSIPPEMSCRFEGDRFTMVIKEGKKS